mgnify:CR=1 FL=1
MGCWSESCALSGLEISDGTDAYAVILKPNKYERSKYDICVPPIKGTYDDYGGLVLLESNEQYNLVKGETFTLVDDDRGDGAGGGRSAGSLARVL